MERDIRLQGTLHISQKPHLLGSPVKELSLKAPFMESLAERCPTTRALLHSSVKVPGIRSPTHIPGSPRTERGPHGERCPYPETFLAYLPGSTSKELPSRSLPRSLFKERCSIPRAPFIQLSNSPVGRALLQVTQTGTLWKEIPVSRAFSTYPSGSPAREPPPPPGSLHRAPTERETTHIQSLFQPYLKVSG